MPEKEYRSNPNSAAKAADLIRQKINALYKNEPSAQQEATEVASLNRLSKHQEFMKELSTSGKSTAQIQTEWHNYYTSLPDNEKHQVWEEFYATSGKQNVQGRQIQNKEIVVREVHHQTDSLPEHKKIRSVSELKRRLNTSPSFADKRKKQHWKSLLFGVTAGAFVVLVMLFGFFNERFIAPLITPSRNVSSTPIIVDPNSPAVSKDPLIIIPKINVQLPVIYDEPSVSEDAIQKALNRGVVHYGTTPYPGQQGNGAIFGHSSGNILNQGKYKYAFTLLRHLETGDTFMLQRGGKLFVYRVYKKHVVAPTDLSVLDTQDKPATFTLITCDPPGLSTNRMIIVGEQVTPNPLKNTSSTATKTSAKPAELPSNSISLWQRLLHLF